MRLKWKLLLALLIAIAAYYLGWWIIIFPLAVFLYGAAGSVYEQVNYIPHEDDHRGIVYFKQDGESYRNSKGETHKMVERGRDTWASDTNWKQR